MPTHDISQRRGHPQISLAAGAMLALLTIAPTVSAAERVMTQSKTVLSDVCHGANIYHNTQVATWDELRASWGDDVPQGTKDFWAERYAFRELGVKSAGGAQPIDENTPLDSLVATWLSPEIIDFFGAFGIPSTEDPEAQNREIYDAKTWVSLAMDRGNLPVADPSLPKYVNVRQALDPVTLEQWNSARGALTLSCYDDGTGRAEFRGRDMLPNIPYTFWAIHAATKQESFDAAGGALMFWPVGGMPVANTTGANGRIGFSRDLHYCPLELDDPFLYLAIYAHYDGNVWGNQLGSNFLDGYGSGTAAAVHLCVSVGEHLLDGG